jgi:glycosyltransferase involved in cell wall biosynthesis
VPPGDPAEVADAIARVLAAAGLAARLRCEARSAAQQWSPDRMLAGYRQAYRAAVPADR